MLEKRRTLELTYRINTWLFVVFLIFSAILFLLGFAPSDETLTLFLYKAILFFNVFYIIHSLFVFILAVIVRVNDKIGSPKIVVFVLLRCIVSIIFTALAMLILNLTNSGF